MIIISNSPETLQRHIDALQKFYTDRDLTVNLDKTKVMIFNTSTTWITRYGLYFTYRDEQIKIVHSYV